MAKIKLTLNELHDVVKHVLNEADTFSNTFSGTQPAQPAQQTTKPLQGDVRTLNNVVSKATVVNKAGSKINTSNEFPGAFKIWFASLGYKPNNPAVNINKVKSYIGQAMKEMGYK